MATLKHIASKNSDYTAIEAYLVYQHDAFTGKQLLDEQGRPKLRESYLLDTLECGDFSFATACLLANRKYGKNTQHNTLVDGHNRYTILQKHPEICFSTMPLRFENREEAVAWICRNQLGRRNLSPEQKRYLLGKQYEAEKKAAKIFRGNQYTLAKKSGGAHDDNHHSGKKTCDRIAEENGVSRASVLRASHYTRGIDIADNLSPGIKQKVFSGEVKFTNEEMSKLVQASVEHRSDVLAQILHPEALEVLESASAEFEPEKAEPVPMPTPQTEEFRCYHVPDEFMKVYKSLSRATEMMKNSWKKTLKNNPSYFTDPEKQKVLRFAMQRPANYLTEIETYLEKALAEALEEEKTA